MTAGQEKCILGNLGHFRPLWGVFEAKGLLKDTFLFEGSECIPHPLPQMRA